MTALRHPVLIVDDDPVLLELIGMIMEQLSQGRWEVHIASTFGRAWERLEHGPVDLLVVDVCMPPPGGLGFIREVHQRFPGTLIVAMSGDNPPGREEACLQQGAQLFLEKPRSGDGWLVVHAMLDERLRLAEEAAQNPG